MTGLDESEEINACTVKVKVDVNGEDEDCRRGDEFALGELALKCLIDRCVRVGGACAATPRSARSSTR